MDLNNFEPFEHKLEDMIDQRYKRFGPIVYGINDKGKKYNVVNNEIKEDKIIVVNAHDYSVKGQHKCPLCGSTEIDVKEETGKLYCNYCRSEFEDKKIRDLFCDVEELDNKIVIGTGALDIEEEASDLVAIECGSCGAEIVVDTNETMQAKCHWCRNTLSVNKKVANGCVPDGVLPFKITKKEAMNEMKRFLKGKRFFAQSRFNREFKEDNVMGVYFPYMVVDINTHIDIKGEGEITIDQTNYDTGSTYDVDSYKIDRDFDLVVRGLTVEATQDKIDKDLRYNTNNIINSILPFDTANAEVWNANYMKGFSSEKRDLNIDDIKEQVDMQNTDIIKVQIKKALKKYNRRGYRIDDNLIDIKGQQWKTLYLPVWIYSYVEVIGNSKMKHYIACNGRTGETMGSVPYSVPKMLGVSALGTLFAVIIEFILFHIVEYTPFCIGPIIFMIVMAKYRNAEVRHSHEIETRVDIKNMKDRDEFNQRKFNLYNAKMKGASRDVIQGNKFNS